MGEGWSRALRIIAINTIITFALLIVAIIVAESIFRCTTPSPDHRGLYMRSSNPTYYSMKPNIELVREGVKIQTNSDGYRDREFEQNSEGAFLIAVLGDSFTFAQGVEQDNSYPQLLEKKLNIENKTRRFRVWNLGVSGYNTFQENYLLKNFVLPRNPDWVVVGYHHNDISPIETAPESANSQFTDTHEEKTSWWARINPSNLIVTTVLKQRIMNIIRKFQPNYYNSSYVVDIVREYEEPNGKWARVVSVLLDEMAQECKSRGVGFTVAILPAMLDFDHHPFNRVNEIVASFCKTHDIDYVDIKQDLHGQNYMSMFVSVIDHHPNALAQQLFAESIFRHLQKTIGSRKGNYDN